MSDYIVKVVMGGDVWFIHAKGERVNSDKSASRYTLAEAEAIAQVMRSQGAEALVIERPRMGY